MGPEVGDTWCGDHTPEKGCQKDGGTARAKQTLNERRRGTSKRETWTSVPVKRYEGSPGTLFWKTRSLMGRPGPSLVYRVKSSGARDESSRNVQIPVHGNDACETHRG